MKLKEAVKDWKKIVSLLILALTTIRLYNHTEYLSFIIINLALWIAIAFYTYRSIYRYIDSIIITNDKIFLGSQIIGAIIAVTCGTISTLILLGSIEMVQGQSRDATSTMIFGLSILGVFIAFRTRRKYFSIFAKKQPTRKP